MTKGFIFKSSAKSESECLEKLIFGADRAAKDEVLNLRPGDKLFLLNVDSDTLMGTFEAASKGSYQLMPDAWRGNYPYQVKIQSTDNTAMISDAKRTLQTLGLNSHRFLQQFELEGLVSLLLKSVETSRSSTPSRPSEEVLKDLAEQLTEKRQEGSFNGGQEKPTLESTTLWDYPTQSYGRTPKGDNKYAGVTPAFIIWNLVKRYTDPGDLIVDPMCGSGTTIDVAEEEGRRAIGYDIVSVRPDVIQNDARNIPLENDSVDLVFIDSPYGDNIKYNDHPNSIGNLSAESEEFYEELEKVMREAFRILKPGKVLGWLIGDQWVKKRFTPVGFKVYQRLTKYFEPLDVVCVVRRSQTSNTGFWHTRAIRFNFFLRGFKYLHVMKKPEPEPRQSNRNRKVKWTHYKR